MADARDESVTPGLRFSGAMLQTTPRDFKVSWAMVLDPIGEGRTRLIERVRVRYDGAPGRRTGFMSSLLGSACSSWSGARCSISSASPRAAAPALHAGSRATEAGAEDGVGEATPR